MTKKTEAQLNTLIEKLKADLESTEQRANEAENELELVKEREESGTNTWAQPMEWEEKGLPMPRLELHWEREDEEGYSCVCHYVLVKRHLTDAPKKRVIQAHPLGRTGSSGSPRSTFLFGEFIDTPFRDNAHAKFDAQQLGLPLYITTEDGDIDQYVFAVGAKAWHDGTSVKHTRVK